MKVIRDPYLRPFFTFYFIVNFGRALTFAFFPLYLSHVRGLDPLLAGYALGGALAVGTLCGLYLGVQVDRLTPLRVLPAAMAALAALYLVIPLAHRFYQLAILLALIEIAFTALHLSSKSLLTGLLPAETRGAAYAVTYTLINIAFCVAPVLGIALGHYASGAPMAVSAALCLIALAVFLPATRSYRHRFSAMREIAGKPMTTGATLRLLFRDTRLRLFTLGGFLSALVYARFSTWLSQYLVYRMSEIEAEKLTSLIVAINATTVICLQYAIGRRIGYRNMLSSVLIASGLLVAGLMLYQASATYIFWAIATVLFSIGEVIIVPAEFLFIDSIAREGMKGAYFGAQNFSMLGGGLSSIVCGMILADHHVAPGSLFGLMAVCALAGGALYALGARRA